MIQMLCMNKLEDYEKWRPVFDGNIEMAVKAGLHLKNILALSRGARYGIFPFRY